MTLTDLPTTLSHLALLLAGAANAHAIAIAVGVRRVASAATLRRLARRCGLSVVVLLGLSTLSFVLTVREGFVATDPSQAATRLANAISEGMNCTAFVVIGCALPTAVMLWLLRRARRAP